MRKYFILPAVIDGMLEDALDGRVLGCQKGKFIDNQDRPFIGTALLFNERQGFFPIRERGQVIAGVVFLNGLRKIFPIEDIVFFLSREEDAFMRLGKGLQDCRLADAAPAVHD